MKKMKSLLVASFAAILMIGMVSSVGAISFTMDNGEISPSSTNYGTISLSMNGMSIDVAVSMASGYKLGGGFGFGVDGSVEGLSVSNITSAGPDPWTLVFPTGNIFDGFGSFDAALIRSPSAENRVDALSFTISRTAGFTTVGDLLEYNQDPRKPYFVTHVYPTAPGNTTGFAAASLAPVAEPTTMLLLGLGLVGLAGAKRKLKK
jgi:hypothetical protein